MGYENICMEKCGKVGLIMLDWFKVFNVLNGVLIKELCVVLDGYDVDEWIGCVVIIGLEKVFVVGVDIKEMYLYFFFLVYQIDLIMFFD